LSSNSHPTRKAFQDIPRLSTHDELSGKDRLAKNGTKTAAGSRTGIFATQTEKPCESRHFTILGGLEEWYRDRIYNSNGYKIADKFAVPFLITAYCSAFAHSQPQAGEQEEDLATRKHDGKD